MINATKRGPGGTQDFTGRPMLTCSIISFENKRFVMYILKYSAVEFNKYLWMMNKLCVCCSDGDIVSYK